MYTNSKKFENNKNIDFVAQKRSKGVCYTDNRSVIRIENNSFLSRKDIQKKSFNETVSKEPVGNESWLIGESSIHGKGVIAGKKLNKEKELGKVATLNEKNINITSNFGSLINHQSMKKANAKINKKGSDFFLKTERTIHQGEEITTDYDSAEPYFAKSKSNFKEV
ncbi:SET domain-containing protein-lysine N-methyltransferase [Tenacibaculum sp. FZY0031]|uniref:SET domain-containing protein-lysine N-methyltransferase n=1 Tax=Tenacibaculum sp. FZY0031 TaxID=3116648 RepID=UPI002EAF8230|nr:SET domain-containing protein-lysine N-methyltransferase [Tenacibaculum sp. FZY0031]